MQNNLTFEDMKKGDKVLFIIDNVFIADEFTLDIIHIDIKDIISAYREFEYYNQDVKTSYLVIKGDSEK